LNHAIFFLSQGKITGIFLDKLRRKEDETEKSSRNKHSLGLTVLLMRHLHLLLILAEESKNKLLKEN